MDDAIQHVRDAFLSLAKVCTDKGLDKEARREIAETMVELQTILSDLEGVREGVVDPSLEP